MKISGTNTNISPQVLLVATIVNQAKKARPFNSANANGSYAHLCSLCQKKGIDLHITHFNNLISDTYIFTWEYIQGTWQLGEHPISDFNLSYAHFTQYSPESDLLRNILLENNIPVLNDLRLSDCVTDKLETYQMFPQHVPPTYASDDEHLFQKLISAPEHPDLNFTKLILKPRYGERAEGIQVIDLKEVRKDYVKNRKDYVVQPILETGCGIPELKIKGRHDLRMIIYNGKIVQFYIREPKNGSIVSNNSSGGKINYYEIKELPKEYRLFAKNIDLTFQEFTPRLYSVDIGIGPSGKIWIFELNTMPGIVWDNQNPRDMEKNIELYEIICEILSTPKIKTIEKEAMLQ